MMDWRKPIQTKYCGIQSKQKLLCNILPVFSVGMGLYIESFSPVLMTDFFFNFFLVL